MGADAPKKSLVENYMIEIARNYKIDYEPDPTMFLVSCRVWLCMRQGMYGGRVTLQEDDGIPAAAELGEPYLPDGSEAGPLPHKREVPDGTRYTAFPPSSGPASQPQPPASNQGVSQTVCIPWMTAFILSPVV